MTTLPDPPTLPTGTPDGATTAGALGSAEAFDAAWAAEDLPDLLLALMERRHLSAFDSSRWQVTPAPDGDAGPLLHEVLGLGRSRTPLPPGPAMTQVLTACHTPGQATVSVLFGDGTGHRIFYGGRRTAGGGGGSATDFLAGQAGALQAHFPGMRLGPALLLGGSSGPDRTALSDVAAFLNSAPALAVVTGIPSGRPDAAGRALQSTDRLAAALGGRRYALVTVAEPLGTDVLDETLDRTRRLRGDTHAQVRRTLSLSRADGVSASLSESHTEGGAEGALGSGAGYLAVLGAFCTAAGSVAATEKWRRRAGLGGPAMTGLSRLPAMMAGESHSTTRQTATSRTVTRGATTEVLDANAQACEEVLQRHLDRMTGARGDGWWRLSVYVAADGDTTLAAVTGALRGICTGPGTDLDPIRVLRPDPWAVRAAITGARSLTLRSASGGPAHPLGAAYDSLGTCVTSAELAVPTGPPQREMAGVPMRETGEFALTAPPGPEDPAAAVHLGELLDPLGRPLQPVTLTAEALNRHVLIAGMTGYGKTTTAKSILTQAHTRLDVPFLVIEPVKAEYRALAHHPELRGRLRVYAIGADGVLPLRLNPLAPVDSVPLLRHIDLLKAVFNAAFPMFAGMSYVLEEALLEVYEERGWNLHTSLNDVLGTNPSVEDRAALTPRLRDLHDKIEEVLQRRGYGPEVHQNMGAALRSRIGSLLVGAKGMALDTRRSLDPRELFERPCVIELRNLGDDEEKAFVMALLLSLLYEHAEARQHLPRPDAPSSLRHLTLIEEAHRLLRAGVRAGGAESPDAQAKAVTLFTDLLAEMRAYGEGFIVADQIPSKLAPETLKNSNVKILHRLAAHDDRAAVAAATNLDDAQSRHLAVLPPGEAVVHDDRMHAAALTTITPRYPEPAPGVVPDSAADRTYLHRNAACVKCSRPCTYRPTARHVVPTHPALLAFFETVLRDADPEQAWHAWTVWREAWQAGNRVPDEETRKGRLYCTSTQAGHRWLRAREDDRARAGDATLRFLGPDGSVRGPAADSPANRPGPGPLPAPDRLLAVDHASRSLARLCAAWLTARTLDKAGRRSFTDTHRSLRAQVAERPVNPHPGCAQCPARCLYEPQAARHLPALGGTLAARAAAPVSTTQRVRALERAAAEDPALHPTWTALPDRTDRRHLLYCLVTQSASQGSRAIPDDVLQALIAGPSGPDGGS
ncbi:helicase HerA domain-containing protein [Streptomyces sp. NPDC001935]